MERKIDDIELSFIIEANDFIKIKDLIEENQLSIQQTLDIIQKYADNKGSRDLFIDESLLLQLFFRCLNNSDVTVRYYSINGIRNICDTNDSSINLSIEQMNDSLQRIFNHLTNEKNDDNYMNLLRTIEILMKKSYISQFSKSIQHEMMEVLISRLKNELNFDIIEKLYDILMDVVDKRLLSIELIEQLLQILLLHENINEIKYKLYIYNILIKDNNISFTYIDTIITDLLSEENFNENSMKIIEIFNQLIIKYLIPFDRMNELIKFYITHIINIKYRTLLLIGLKYLLLNYYLIEKQLKFIETKLLTQKTIDVTTNELNSLIIHSKNQFKNYPKIQFENW